MFGFGENVNSNSIVKLTNDGYEWMQSDSGLLADIQAQLSAHDGLSIGALAARLDTSPDRIKRVIMANKKYIEVLAV